MRLFLRKITFLLLIAILCFSSVALAHSGKTDSSGGHYNRSTGEYHYHHGRSAHQHPGGVCPYSNNLTKSDSGASSSGTVQKSASTEEERTKQTAAIVCGLLFNPLSLFGMACGVYSIKEKRKVRKAELEILQKYKDHSLSEMIPIPNGVYIGKDGLPTTDSTGNTWGIYTMFSSSASQSYKAKYHTHKCRYAKFKIHAYYAQKTMQPCGSCKPRFFDFSWYDEYLKIMNLKKKYNFPLKDDPILLPEKTNERNT